MSYRASAFLPGFPRGEFGRRHCCGRREARQHERTDRPLLFGHERRVLRSVAGERAVLRAEIGRRLRLHGRHSRGGFQSGFNSAVMSFSRFLVCVSRSIRRSVFVRCSEGRKRCLKFFQRSLKLQLKLAARPPPQYAKTSLYNRLGIHEIVAVCQNVAKVKP